MGDYKVYRSTNTSSSASHKLPSLSSSQSGPVVSAP